MAESSQTPRHRSRFARLLALFAVGVCLIWGVRAFHSRAVEIELVHRFPSGDALLPARIEVQVWSDRYLHANASFFNPTSLETLGHSVIVPPGDYEVTYSVFSGSGETSVRFARPLNVEDTGRYFLHYELTDDGH